MGIPAYARFYCQINIKNMDDRKIIMTSQNESILEESEQIFGQKMTFGRVWSNLWGLVTSPRKTIPKFKENDQIGWLLGSVFIVYFIIMAVVYLLIYLVSKKTGFDPFAILSLFVSEAWFPSFLMVIYAVFILVISVLMGWVIFFFFGHLLANIYGGRGKWWQLAVDALYIQLLSAIVTPIISLLLFIATFVEGTTIHWILYFIIVLAWLIWFIILYVLIIKDVYRLPTWRATLAVLTPIIILAGIIAGGYYYYKATSKVSPLERATSTIGDTLGYGNLNVNFSWNLGNINLNTNTNMAINNISLDQSLKLSEKESNERTQKVDRTLNYVDVRRQNELITLKYDLLEYYEVYKKFPISNGLEKLDGQTDSVYLALKDFQRFYIGLKDPEHPKYYYGYESDGKTFTLTAYLTSAKKVFQLTNQ